MPDAVFVWGRTAFDAEFLAAYFAGLLILLVFSFERFNTPAPIGQRFVECLIPRHIVDNAEYTKAFIVYMFIMVLLYTFLSILGPHLEAAFTGSPGGGLGPGASTTTPIEAAVKGPAVLAAPWIPLAVVICLSGLATQYEQLNKIEVSVRRLAHRIIGIPNGITDLASRIAQTAIKPYGLDENDRGFFLARYRELMADETKTLNDLVDHIERNSVIRRYLRLRFLFDRFENRRQQLPSIIDTGVMLAYGPKWLGVKSGVYDLATSANLALIAAHGIEEGDQELSDRIQQRAQTVSDTLDDLHVLIAISIARNSSNQEQVLEAMKSLGLTSNIPHRDEMVNGVIIAMAMLFGSILMLVFLTPHIVDALGLEPSDAMPDTPIDALRWATSAVCLHGAAAWAVLPLLGRKSWRPMHVRTMQIPSLQYVKLMVRAYVAACIGLLCWWYVSELFKGVDLTLPGSDQRWISHIRIARRLDRPLDRLCHRRLAAPEPNGEPVAVEEPADFPGGHYRYLSLFPDLLLPCDLVR